MSAKKAQKLTVEEIATLIKTNVKFEQTKWQWLSQAICQVVGITVPQLTPDQKQMQETMENGVYTLVAKRLKRNRTDRPLLSERDLKRSSAPTIDLVMKEYTKEEGPLTSSETKEARVFFTNLLGQSITGMIETLEKTLLDFLSKEKMEDIKKEAGYKKLYQGYWRWLQIIVDLAAEKGLPPVEFFNTQEGKDRVTSKVYSKTKFLKVGRRLIAQLTNPEWIGGMLVGGALLYQKALMSSLGELTEEDKKEGEEMLVEARKEIDDQIMPKLQVFAPKLRKQARSFLIKEISRIYGVAA